MLGKAVAAALAAAFVLFAASSAPAADTAPNRMPHLPPDPAQAPVPDPAEAARAFLLHLYTTFGAGTRGSAHEDMYDKSMLALIAENVRLTPQGDTPSLDWDPFCQCKDWGRLQADVKVTMTSPIAATAEVFFRDVKWNEPHDRHATMLLVLEDGKWRIYDIKSSDFESRSMRTFLTNENRERRAKALH